MSIFDASVQEDWTRDDLIAKIKAAESKYYNESPCLHCGPGNGCDDCRGCEDSKRNYELEMMLRNAKEAYKNKFGHSYEQDVMYNQIENKEKEYNTWKVKCQKCGGNFDEDCKDCKDWEEKFNIIKSLNWLKEEFKRKFKLDYNIINKNTIKNDMMIDEKRDLNIDKGVSIKEWIEYNIKNYSVENFFDYINNNNWDEISDSVKQALLNEIQTKIKPKEINNISDLAKLLNNNLNGNELENPYNIDVESICKKNKWIILFPYSDDNLEIRGYIDDEVGAWDDTKYKLIKRGDFYPDEDEENTYHKAKTDMIYYSKNTPNISMKWCPKDHPYTWWIETNYINNTAYFNILNEDDEDDHIWARCCIIDCSNIL